MLDPSPLGSSPVLDQRGASVRLSNVSKRYGSAFAVRDISLSLEPGEFLTLLGPSGSGKTTTLSAIAGFSDLTSGKIEIGGRRVDMLPPEDRDIGVVFQHYALFPHMSVAENVAFPLQMRGIGRAQTKAKVDSVLESVRMLPFANRFPAQLSGGQQQRVALARAIVFDPPLMLLDEPLGALDKSLREHMQIELRALHRETGITMIYVTHDQEEALVLSDRVAVMHDGVIEQVDPPASIYGNPNTKFVASFIGESSFIDGMVVSRSAETAAVRHGENVFASSCIGAAAVGDAVDLMIRPEHLVLGDAAAELPNVTTGQIVEGLFIGGRLKVQVRLATDALLVAAMQNDGSGKAAGKVGEMVRVGWRPEHSKVFAQSNEGRRV
jgi:putative spermidine/putrescine transport system ATP-binding protein